MNIKDATSTLLVSAALTGLFAGPAFAQETKDESTTTVKTEKVEKKATKKCGHKSEKKCAEKGSCKGKESCKGAKEETK
jgi:hypothetical protein